MKIKDIIIGLFVISLISLMAWLWLAPSGLKQAPEVTFKIIDGRSIQLSKLQGQPVLVTFWATSCPGCIREMPHLVELYREFNQQGLEIIGVAMPYDRPDHVQEMVRSKQLPYPIALDVMGEVVNAFGQVRLTPTSFLIAPDGRIVKHKIGEMDMEKLKTQIHSMLSKI